mgnify:CR=1 FL=1
MTKLSLPLSNVQLELLKLYATDLSEEELLELKRLLARFFAEKAMRQADEIWEKKGLTDEDMDRWLNQPS